MNILEAYLIQKKSKFVVLFSSPDEKLLKEIIYNLSKDFKAEVLNLYPYLKEMENLDNRLLEKFFNVESQVVFVIGPAFPTYYIKGLKSDYHINISLSKSLSIERGVDKNVFKINEEYSSIKYSFKKNKVNNQIKSSINKTFNLAKFSSTKSLEDEIFNELIEMIKKKLDGGKYLKKLESGVRKSEDDLDKEIIEEVNLNTYMSDDEMMSEVNFETSKSDFIIGGMRKLNK
jgi:hypothetical protein